MIKITLLALIFFTSFLTGAEENKKEVKQKTSTELSQHLGTLTPAIRTKTVMPKYPIQAARDGAEGWVKLSYVIDTKGDVKDVLVIGVDGDGVYTRKDFIKQAKLAVKKWKYTPAINQQGENIASCKNLIQLDFAMDYSSGDKIILDADFLELLKISFKAIETKDSGKLKELIIEIDELGVNRTKERAWTHYIEMKYFGLINDKENTYEKLKESYSYVDSTNRRYTEPAVLDILENLLIMEVEKQLYRNARDTFNTLKQFDSELAQQLKSYYQPFMTQIDQLVTGEKNILVKGKISNNKKWHHRLVRNELSISNIEGKLTVLEVRCDYKHSTYTIKEDSAWKIPKAWGECNIFVEGDSDSSFDIYELPEKI
jgi:TonB family protein